jgi:hypothetical protein
MSIDELTRLAEERFVNSITYKNCKTQEMADALKDRYVGWVRFKYDHYKGTIGGTDFLYDLLTKQ